MINLTDALKNLEKSDIIAGIIGAIFSQIIVGFVVWRNRICDKRLKKKLINTDLESKKMLCLN